ncbi:MAG: hypothetical protein M0R76_00090 [Proteobacteria bacterium]|nr:hypothetical protein [Pseudomonadota bacterium]
MGSYNWVQPADLVSGWLGAQPHQMEYVENRRSIADSGVPTKTLGQICTRLTQGPNPKYEAHDVPCVVTRTVYDERPLLLDDCNWVSMQEHLQLKRFKLKPYDVLVTLKGVGACKVNIFLLSDTAIHSREVGVLRLQDGADAPFLSAYLRAKYGKLLLRQGTLGTAQVTLATSYLRQLPVPFPDQRIRSFIGAKVELAGRFLLESRTFHEEASSALAKHWAWTAAEESIAAVGATKAHMVDCEIFDDRLDSEFYQPRFLALSDWLTERECWDLGELVEPPAKGVQPTYDLAGTIPALTVTHVDPFLLERANATGFVTETWLRANPRARIEAGELLFTVTGPPLGETVVVEDFHLPAAVNSHIARVRTKDAFPYPHLLAAMLNSPLGRLMTTRFCKGIRQKELYPEDFLRFRFPRIPETQVTPLDRKFQNSCRLAERARALIQEAKADVEALIDGTLDTKAILSGKLKPPTEEEVLGA